MPFIPVPDTLQVETVFELYGQVVENTAYFKNDAGWTESSISDFLDAMRSLVETDLMPSLSTAIKFVRLIGTLLDAVDSLGIVLSVTPPVTGSNVGAGLPNNSAYVITFNTATRGRSGRGRNYIAGLTTADESDANTVNDMFRTGIIAYYTALKALGSENGATMVVASRYSGVDADGKPIPRATGVTYPITGFSTFDRTLDSQRRRLPGRGA